VVPAQVVVIADAGDAGGADDGVVMQTRLGRYRAESSDERWEMGVSESRKGEQSQKAAIGVLDALTDWRDTLAATNERCLARVLDRVTAAQLAMGWPEHVVDAARASFLQASRAQRQIADQIIETWERQLRSVGDDASMVPQRFMYQATGFPASPFGQSAPDLMRLGEMSFAPFKMWFQAADMWQRDWARAMSIWTGPSQPRSNRDLR
jgi:hypothetical protein